MYLKWSVFKSGLRLELLRVNQCDIPASVSQVLHEPLIISQSCLPSRKQTKHVGSKKTPVWNHPSNWSDDVCLLKTVDRYRLCVPINCQSPPQTNYPTFTDLSLTDLGHCSILRTPLPPSLFFFLTCIQIRIPQCLYNWFRCKHSSLPNLCVCTPKRKITAEFYQHCSYHFHIKTCETLDSLLEPL